MRQVIFLRGLTQVQGDRGTSELPTSWLTENGRGVALEIVLLRGHLQNNYTYLCPI